MLDSIPNSKSSPDKGKIKPVESNAITNDIAQELQTAKLAVHPDDLSFTLKNDKLVVNAVQQSIDVSQKLSIAYSKRPIDRIIYKAVEAAPNNDIKILVK